MMIGKMTIKTWWMIVFCVFLLSCKQQLPNETDISINETMPAANLCTAHWECVNEEYQRHQQENCTWSKPEKCGRGCINGTCRAARVCTVGFKCIDASRRGYQKEDCSFANKISCEGGCEDGKCKPKSENTTLVNETAASSPAPAAPTTPTTSYTAENQDGQVEKDKTIYSLKLGEQQAIEIAGKKHNISLYNIDSEQAILKVDGLKSEWIKQGGNFTYGNIGATFYIESILFQTYGTKAIDFTIS